MMRSWAGKTALRVTTLVLLLPLTPLLQAATWSLTYPRPLDEQDMRNEYPVALLQLALEKTGVSYSLSPSDRILLQGKALRQLRENREVNVVWSMTDVQREKDLLAIRIPIAKGLIGLRLPVINRRHASKIAAVNDAAGLRQLTAIQGEEWPDTKILQANGFNVLTVREYNDGYHALAQNRGDFFPRSVIEVTSELAEKGRDEDLILNDRLALYYPSAMYFFVNRGNPTLARLIETGLKRAIKDGSFDVLFNASYAPLLKELNIDERTVFVFENPLLPPNTPLGNDALWYRTEGFEEE
ncbi:amino acid ABC transporter substrate-binding protein [Alteromonas sp. CYL-A6]|uniref:amino acid ABC transporter substrate-binding protein n=1 Tax=Alteromonas nitratireducens TaxID=3390813 RepID=UPI0034BA4157